MESYTIFADFTIFFASMGPFDGVVIYRVSRGKVILNVDQKILSFKYIFLNKTLTFGIHYTGMKICFLDLVIIPPEVSIEKKKTFYDGF